MPGIYYRLYRCVSAPTQMCACLCFDEHDAMRTISKWTRLFISNMTNLSLIRLFWSQIDLFDLHLMTFFFTTWFSDLFIVIIIIWLLLLFLSVFVGLLFWFRIRYLVFVVWSRCFWFVQILQPISAAHSNFFLIWNKWYWWFMNGKKTVIVTSKCCLFNFLEVDFNVW